MPTARRADLRNDTRALIVRGAESLGVLGAGASAAPRLIALLCRAQVTAAEVAALVEREPALYARVLRVANSSYYGHRAAIRTLQQALVLLGLDAVRGIAAAACLDRSLRGVGADVPIDMKALVTHSLATACAAELLARARAPALAPDTFIAGLLHNLGVAVQLHVDRDGVRSMIERRRTEPACSLHSLEASCIAVGHEECVATVFEAWGFPGALVASARHHHAPALAPEEYRRLATLVHVGAQLAVRTGHTFVLEPGPATTEADSLALLALDEPLLRDVAAALPGRVALLSGALADG